MRHKGVKIVFDRAGGARRSFICAKAPGQFCHTLWRIECHIYRLGQAQQQCAARMVGVAAVVYPQPPRRIAVFDQPRAAPMQVLPLANRGHQPIVPRNRRACGINKSVGKIGQIGPGMGKQRGITGVWLQGQAEQFGGVVIGAVAVKFDNGRRGGRKQMKQLRQPCDHPVNIGGVFARKAAQDVVNRAQARIGGKFHKSHVLYAAQPFAHPFQDRRGKAFDPRLNHGDACP